MLMCEIPFSSLITTLNWIMNSLLEFDSVAYTSSGVSNQWEDNSNFNMPYNKHAIDVLPIATSARNQYSLNLSELQLVIQ